jgi:hypothetical protein
MLLLPIKAAVITVVLGGGSNLEQVNKERIEAHKKVARNCL